MADKIPTIKIDGYKVKLKKTSSFEWTAEFTLRKNDPLYAICNRSLPLASDEQGLMNAYGITRTEALQVLVAEYYKLKLEII